MFLINVCSLNKKLNTYNLNTNNLQILIMILLQYQKKKIMRNLEITKNIDIKNYNRLYIN